MAVLEEKYYWLGFSLFPGIGPKKFALLLDTFTTAKDAWGALESELLEVLGPALMRKFVAYRPSVDLLTYSKQLEKAKVWFLLLSDPEYPQLLKEIEDPPYVLYGIGDKSSLLVKKTIGVVGTRKITSYGKQVTEMIASDMVRAGFCVVSGLAMGVDAVAHVTALNEKGTTIAVLGCGVDCCNPRVNESLYQKIIANGGCVVSEFPLGQEPTVGSFPSRNRIIAGLSQAVIVTEGAVDSGALITASDALKNNRPVFAIPGPITSLLSKGPNKLLREGARLVTTGDEILQELGIMNKDRERISRREIKGDSEEEQVIISALQSEELSFDDLLLKTSFIPSQLNMLLSVMEMKGKIMRTNQGNFQLST